MTNDDYMSSEDYREREKELNDFNAEYDEWIASTKGIVSLSTFFEFQCRKLEEAQKEAETALMRFHKAMDEYKYQMSQAIDEEKNG